MYIIRNKSTQQILWQNADQYDGSLPPGQAYAGYDPETMEWGWSKEDTVPEYFKLDPANQIIPSSRAALVAEGLMTLEPHEKLENGQVVEKPLAEQVADGLIVPEAHQKVEGNQLVAKTEAELVADGLRSLAPHEKLVGSAIVAKPLAEQVAEGLLTLPPDQKIVNGQAVPKTLEEQVKEGIVSLDAPFAYAEGDQVKQRSVEECLKKGLLATEAQCQRATRLLQLELNAQAARLYPQDIELRLLRRYIAWQEDGKPDNDTRQQEYKTLMADLEALEAKQAPLLEKVEARRQTLAISTNP